MPRPASLKLNSSLPTSTRVKISYEVYPKVFERFGKNASIAGFGVAGEYGYANSGIVFNDLAKRPSRYSGRGGLGAVMASKGLKFIVVDSKGAPGVSHR